MFFLQMINSESLHGLDKTFKMVPFNLPFCMRVVANVKKTLANSGKHTAALMLRTVYHRGPQKGPGAHSTLAGEITRYWDPVIQFS